MLATLSIFLAAIAVCLLAGIAVCGLADPGGRWLGPSTIPLGLCSLIGVLYFTGAALSAEDGVPVVLTIVAVALGAAVWRRRRLAADGPLGLGAALRPTRRGAIALGNVIGNEAGH